MTAFPNTPGFTGFFAPSGVEGEVRNLPVIDGAIPPELDGSFYRVAPDPQFAPLAGDDIWFNGDGMVTRFRFRDGAVDLQQRWARTRNREGTWTADQHGPAGSFFLSHTRPHKAVGAEKID